MYKIYINAFTARQEKHSKFESSLCSEWWHDGFNPFARFFGRRRGGRCGRARNRYAGFVHKRLLFLAWNGLLTSRRTYCRPSYPYNRCLVMSLYDSIVLNVYWSVFCSINIILFKNSLNMVYCDSLMTIRENCNQLRLLIYTFRKYIYYL